MTIHSTAIIAADADIHPTAVIGPYSIIGAGVRIGECCVIDSHARIEGAAQLGRGNRVCHGVTLGAEPQDLAFTPDQSKPLMIGDYNHFKEGVNISRGVKTDAGTQIGDHNYFMSFSHAGHDCIIGNHNILANTATLAGHVTLGNRNFLAGQVAVHQFCRIGDLCMVGGITGVSQDLPPFVLANGQRARIIGLNTVGLRRQGFDQSQRSRIKAVYRLIFNSSMRLRDALDEAASRYPAPETDLIINFIRAGDSGRGIARFRDRNEDKR